MIKDGAKMSKSLGNVVSPAEIIEKYGADTARLFILFAAPPERELDWSDQGVEGSYRFINRVYWMVYEFSQKYKDVPDTYQVKNEADKSLAYWMNYAIKKVSDDVGDRFNFNTAISTIMEMVNEMYRYKEGDINPGLYGAAVKTLIILLAPFVPHVTEEMWEHLGYGGSVHDQKWPEYDEKALVKDTIEIVVQINGRIKEKINIAGDSLKEEMEKIAVENDKIKALTEGKNIVKIIAVPNKLINIVVK